MYKRPFPLSLLFVVVLLSAPTILSQENLPELVRQVKPSVVAVTTFDGSGEPLMTGSGFFVRPGQVVTNLHVIRGAVRAEIKTLDGKGKTYPVTGAVGVDEEGDLVILNIDMPADRPRSVEFAAVLPDEGERIFVVGNPLKLEGSVSDGIVSAVREVPNVGRIVQITAPVSHGNSGSPVFNLKGQVVGVVTVKVTNGQNINLAIAAARVSQLTPGRLRPLSEVAKKDRAADLADPAYRNGLESLWLGNYDNALAYFENAVNKNPRRADAWIQVGYCKVKQGKNDEAIRAYKEALRLKPDSADLRNKLGDAYYYARRLDEAIACYKEAVRLRPDNPEAYYNLAIAYDELGDQSMVADETHQLQKLDDKLYRKFLTEAHH
ncbi:MAG TPA: tetratricopeptide repeat-containing serine protease family protein [Pyrinomonadaceae bacterium]